MSDRGDNHDVNLKSILAKLQVLRNSCEGIPHIEKSDPTLIWLQGAATMLQEAVEQLEKAAKWQSVCNPLVGRANTSREVLKQLALQEPRVKVFCNSSNKGFGFTLRRLLKEAKGGSIVYCDCDCLGVHRVAVTCSKRYRVTTCLRITWCPGKVPRL